MTEAKPRPPRSEAAREASRRNGAKSRGPKTADGKAISARNSLKHGLRARKTITPATMPAPVRELEAALSAALAPVSVHNGEQLERLVFSQVLLSETELSIAAELGRLDEEQRRSSCLPGVAELDLLEKLFSYRRRFHGTRNQALLKLKPPSS